MMENDKKTENNSKEKKTHKQNKQRPALKNSKRVFLFILGLVLTAAGIFWGFKFSKPYKKDKEYTSLSYDITADSAYSVYLKKSKLFDEEILPENRLYPTKLTDSIELEFDIGMSANKEVEISGDYSLVKVIEGYQIRGETKKVIYDKKLDIKQDNIDKEIRSELKIKEKVSIKPQEYRSYAEKAETLIGGGMSRNMYILLEADFNIDGHEEKLTYSFPIFIGSEHVYDIEKPEAVNIHNEIKEKTDILITPKLFVYLPFIILTVIGIGLTGSVIFIFRSKNEEELKEEKMYVFMRRYGSRMTAVENCPDEGERPVLRVKTMVGMIELAEDMRSPILYTPDAKGLPREHKICVLGTDYMYVYKQ